MKSKNVIGFFFSINGNAGDLCVDSGSCFSIYAEWTYEFRVCRRRSDRSICNFLHGGRFLHWTDQRKTEIPLGCIDGGGVFSGAFTGGECCLSSGTRNEFSDSQQRDHLCGFGDDRWNACPGRSGKKLKVIR